MGRLLAAALTDGDLRPLPGAAVARLTALSAPPRLAGHLRAVLDVAHRLTGGPDDLLPRPAEDADARLACPGSYPL